METSSQCQTAHQPLIKDNRTPARQLTMSYANKAKRHEYKNREQGGPMRQPHGRAMTIYADIGEVRMEVRVSDCNQMLADVWLLLGIYPLTTVAEMRDEDRKSQQRTCGLPRIISMMMTVTA
jgi:hypothetical protein